MEIIDGRKIAAEILAKLKAEPFNELRARKFLAVILVGDDAASLSFVKQKEKTAKELGVDFRLYKFASDIKNDKLRDEVRKIAEHQTCGGVIVQLPLPEHVNAQYVLNAIPREKDVDVLSERALGAFYASRNPVLPPAVGVVQEILAACCLSLVACRVAVVGLGQLVGKPISMWLMRKVAGLYLLHRGSDFLLLKNADLVISGVGKAGVIKPEMLKIGAGIIDFGYDRNMGDLDTSDAKAVGKLAFYTPTPGGTGPILVAKVFENFYGLNAKPE